MFDEKKFMKKVSEVNPGNYDMNIREMQEIYTQSNDDIFRMMITAFKFGFLKGQRQAKAQAKKARKTA